MIANYDRLHMRILKYVGGISKKIPKSSILPRRIEKNIKDKVYKLNLTVKEEKCY